MNARGIRNAGLVVMVAGAVAQAVGLAIDTWLHVEDPSLSSREALFTTDNLGHVLLLVGIVLVVTGAGLTLLGPWLYGRSGEPRSRGRQALGIAAPVAMVVALVAGTSAAADSSLAHGHDHDDTAAADEDGPNHGDAAEHGAGDEHASHTPEEHAAAIASEDGGSTATAGVEQGSIGEDIAGSTGSHGHGHGDGTVIPNQPLDDTTRDALAGQLVQARDVALRYPTVASAEADGYRMITPYVPLIGAHYINFAYMDGTFHLEHPEMLLYDGTAPDAEMVGLSYYQLSGAAEPEGFAGPNDHWHQHRGLCINRQTVVVGGSQISEEECHRRGGQKVDGANGWMVHAWVVPGWESPQGVFSAENPDLT